jgi:dihydrofolate synthase/folylpolyglutamate synthase
MPSIQTYHDALEFLLTRVNFERAVSQDTASSQLKLSRMHQIMERLGHPEMRIPAFHVAGTKGKGSTCHLVEHFLRHLGYRTGLFTSPHRQKYEERMMINGECLPPEEIVETVRELVERFSEDEAGSDLLKYSTFFELTTAVAWMLFEKYQVHFAILEVGMGGLLDTTNLCHPLVTAITSIDFDHMKFLGNTIPEIASQKAGIIKPGVPVINAARHPEAIRVVRETARTLHAPHWKQGQDLCWQPSEPNPALPGSDFHAARWIEVQIQDQVYKSVPVTMLGQHQADNMCTALGMLEIVRPGSIAQLLQKFETDPTVFDIQIPLRIEVLSQQPLILIDAAHNPLSIDVLFQTLQENYPDKKRIVIFACSKDKDIASMLQLVKLHADTVILTEYTTNPRNLPVSELKAIAEELELKDAYCAANPTTAWHKACELSHADSLICAMGSFFLATETRDIVLGS